MQPRLRRFFPRNKLALGLTAGFHLLALQLWIHERYVYPRAQPEIVSTLLRQPGQLWLLPVSTYSPILKQQKNVTAIKPTRVLPVIPKSMGIRLSNDTPTESLRTRAPATDLEIFSDVKSIEKPDSGTNSNGTPLSTPFNIELARRQARHISVEVSKGESGVLTAASSPWARLGHELNAAHVEPITGVQQDSYTASDGTIIYRKRVGNRTFCRRSGSVGGGGVSDNGGKESAGWISCPSQTEWKREPY
jgi:hypothetical protein